MASPPVYSLRIYVIQNLRPAALVGPTVPPGYLYVVRDIDAWARSGPGATTLFFVGPNENVIWEFSPAEGTGPTGQWRGRQVFYPGEQVAFQVIEGQADVQVSGYQLSQPV